MELTHIISMKLVILICCSLVLAATLTGADEKCPTACLLDWSPVCALSCCLLGLTVAAPEEEEIAQVEARGAAKRDGLLIPTVQTSVHFRSVHWFPVKHFWIGAIRITKQDGTYEYVWQNTVQAVTESSWDVSQPDGHANEECVEIWGGAQRLAWNNIHCSDGNGVICEIIN
ncbi:hypothetical protein B566_EDAN005135 [Ephemera danica]|nr:hypothetical protein B566_EDAN005135 [Ephemera danica]